MLLESLKYQRYGRDAGGCRRPTLRIAVPLRAVLIAAELLLVAAVRGGLQGPPAHQASLVRPVDILRLLIDGFAVFRPLTLRTHILTSTCDRTSVRDRTTVRGYPVIQRLLCLRRIPRRRLDREKEGRRGSWKTCCLTVCSLWLASYSWCFSVRAFYAWPASSLLASGWSVYSSKRRQSRRLPRLLWVPSSRP